MTAPTGRLVNLVLGLWLFLSAFLWRHHPAQFINTWVSGLLIATSAGLASRMPAVRFVSTAVGLWLVISTALVPTTAGTSTHNAIVGLLVSAVSLIRSGPERTGDAPRPRTV